jgi:hypothetical protein
MYNNMSNNNKNKNITNNTSANANTTGNTSINCNTIGNTDANKGSGSGNTGNNLFMNTVTNKTNMFGQSNQQSTTIFIM